MNGVLTVKEAILHSLIVYQILHGLTHLWLGQFWMLLAEGKIHQSTTQFVMDHDAFGIARTCYVFGVQVTSHVDVTTFEQ